MTALFLALALFSTPAHAASDAKCKAAALSAVDEDSSAETSVKTITAGKKYEVTMDGEDESRFEVTFPTGCDSEPVAKELSDDADAPVSHSHFRYGNRCLSDEVYRDGQCCKKNGECPPKKPAKHLHDMPRH